MTEAVKERPMPTGEGLTFEKVWAMYQETDRKFQEDRERLNKETERTVDRASKLLGNLGNNFGALAENMDGTRIAKKFIELGYHFDLVGTKGCEITDRKGKILTEVDILLENGETVIAVEVKAKPVLKDIDHHKKQLKIVKEKIYEHKYPYF
jgi:predicted AAA+ superfamily ATPase